MALLRLSCRLALRNPGRTLITVLGVSLTLIAFLTLRTLVHNWYVFNEEGTRSDQLEVRHKVSISFVLFKRMVEKIRTVPGVEEASALIWFSGYYKRETERFAQLAVDSESYFKVHPEYAATEEQMSAFATDISGIIVGSELAEKYRWKIGEKVTLTGTIFPGAWDFTVRGIYRGGTPATDRARLFMHYKRLDPIKEHCHRIVVKAKPEAARQIDALFAGSDTPTKTQSQLAVQRSWASWATGVITTINFGASIILLILIVVMGNGVAMTARESIREYATMRTLGYKSRHIVVLVLLEGAFIAGIGVFLGLAAARSTLDAFSEVMEQRVGGSWQLDLDPRVAALSVLATLAAAMLASFVPAWQSGRLRIVECLRKVS